MEPKEIRSRTIFGTAKMQVRFRSKNRIVITDFREVKEILRGFILGMWSNFSVFSGRNEKVYGQNEDSGLSAVFLKLPEGGRNDVFSESSKVELMF